MNHRYKEEAADAVHFRYVHWAEWADQHVALFPNLVDFTSSAYTKNPYTDGVLRGNMQEEQGFMRKHFAATAEIPIDGDFKLSDDEVDGD